MIEQMYIDGREVDLGGGGIAMTIRSNIFTDISKITGNNTATIKLPLTANNRSIIQCCFVAGSQSRFPYAAHTATIIRDGVMVVDGATAVLMRTTTTDAEVVLTWGVPNELTKFMSKSATINQLDDLPSTISLWTMGSSRRQPVAEYGFKESEQAVSYHPVLSVAEVLDRIQAKNGITFNFDEKPWEDADLVMPIIKRDALGCTAVLGTTGGVRTIGITGAGRIIETQAEAYAYAYMVACEYRSLTGVLDDIEWWQSGNKVVFANRAPNMKIKLNGRVVICVDLDATKQLSNGDNDPSLWNGGLYAFARYNNMAKGEFLTCKRPDAVYTRAENGKRYTYLEFVYNDEEVRLEDTRMMMFALDHWHSYIAGQFGPCVDPTHRYTASEVRIDSSRDRIGINDTYPLFSNLPKIKQVDFIKAVMQMYAMFAFVGDDGRVQFTSLRNVISSKGNAQDWSDMLVANAEGIPSGCEYVVGEECKSNRMLYKDSDAFPEWNSAYLVNNDALQDERDAITLPFAPYLTRDVAILPVYKYNDEGVLEYDGSDTAYICRREQDSDGEYRLTGFGCKWPELMAHYSDYISVLNNAKVITENFILTPFDLRGVELRRPVYLRQYGQHFAIIEIKTKADNLAEVKLVKI